MVSTSWREGFRLVLDLIKFLKIIKPHGELLMYTVIYFCTLVNVIGCNAH